MKVGKVVQICIITPGCLENVFGLTLMGCATAISTQHLAVLPLL